MHKPLVSLTMIVRNEEAVLGRCLSSVQGLYDELVIVDTGSTDRTVEIAVEHDANVLHFDWQAPGHKGAARNFGIDAATGEWIVVVDADEVVKDPARLRQILVDQKQDAAISVLFQNHADGLVTLSWYQIRAFRRGQLAYKYREHEIPVLLIDNAMIGISDIVFEHHAPPGRANGKSAPMMERLTLDVDENPDDPHPLYFLHRECVNQGQYQRAIDLGLRYLQLTKGRAFIKGDCYANMAMAYQKLGDINQARSSLHLAVAEEPQRRDWWYRLGVLHADCQDHHMALAMLRVAADILPDETRQWEPQLTARIYDLIEHCQRAIRATHHVHHDHHHH